MSKTALEASFETICAAYNVNYIDISINLKQPEDYRFHACVQWPADKGCAMAHGATIEEAMRNCIAKMHESRAPIGPHFADQALPLEIAA